MSRSGKSLRGRLGTAVVKLLDHQIFWNSNSRLRFRSKLRRGSLRVLRRGSLRVKRHVWRSSLKAVPRSQGDCLVERRVSILGIPVFVRRTPRARYRVALLVDEFFGGWETAIGGYGALARKYICRFVPNELIQIDVLLDAYSDHGVQQKLVDQTLMYRLPADALERQDWLDNQAYNLFLTIEMTEPSFDIIRKYNANTPLLYWIQDPRDPTTYQARLRTVNRIRDGDWEYVKDVSIWLQGLMRMRRVSFISQGQSLSVIARRMYEIPEIVPIRNLANPVEIEFDYKLEDPMKNDKIIVLGRLEAQKRAWIACEIAKAMPQYEFCILGATGRGRDEAANAASLEPYRNPDGSSKIKNLHFTGHVDGDVKNSHLKTAKLLLNTSIWEGIPVSWLEALSYGTLIVSAFDRDNIVERFGTFVGEVLGDGTDATSIRLFVDAIEYWLSHDLERKVTAQKAIDFVRQRHSLGTFVDNMRGEILNAI